MAKQRAVWDVVIAGAGPAGLSAALVLGRACRRVLLCDDGTPRSWASHAMYSFVSRDGTHPAEFRRLARAELKRYPNVSIRQATVRQARRRPDGHFTATVGRATVTSRILLLATGLADVLPPVPGLIEHFGTSVFQCPYCDGWETRGKKVAVYGRRNRGFEMARALTAWTRDLVLCTDGPSGFDAAQRRQLDDNGVVLRETRIERLEGSKGRLRQIVFSDGEKLRRQYLYFDMPSTPQSKLADRLGCRITAAGGIDCGRYEETSVPGVFAAGNIIRDVQLSIVAAAEGAKAAFGINRALTRADFATRRADR